MRGREKEITAEMTKMVSNTASMVRIWQNDCFRSMLQSKK